MKKNLSPYYGLFLLAMVATWPADTNAQVQPEIVIQDGHNSDITALAAHPQKNQIASIDASGRLVVWDMDTRMVLRRHELGNIAFASNSRQHLKYSGGGRNIYFNNHQLNWYKSQSQESKVKVVRLKDGKMISQFSEEINFEFGSDSTLLLTTNEYTGYSGDPLFSRSWLVKQPRDSTEKQLSVSFDQKITSIKSLVGENLIALGFFDGTLKVLEASGLSLVWEVKDFNGPVNTIDISAPREWIVYGGLTSPSPGFGETDTLVIRDVLTGAEFQKIDTGPNLGGPDVNGFSKAVFSADGKLLAAISGFKLMIWDTDTFDLNYNDFPSWHFSVSQSIGRINDIVFTSEKGELILTSGNHLFSFDPALNAYSNNFNSGLTENYDYQHIGILGESKYYIHKERDSRLETINVSSFENEIYDYGFWAGLVDKAGLVDTSLQSLAHLSYSHPGNIVTFMPEARRVMVWAVPGTGSDVFRSNYFLEFSIDDWSFRKAHGPFNWDKDYFEKYHRLVHYDPDNDWYIMSGNTLSRAGSTGGFTGLVALMKPGSKKPLLEAEILIDAGVIVSQSGKYISWIDKDFDIVAYSIESRKELYRESLIERSSIIPPVFTSEDELFILNTDTTFTSRIKKIRLEPVEEEVYLEVNSSPTAWEVTGDYLAIASNFDYSLDKWQDSVDHNMQQYGIDYFTDPHVLVIDRESENKEIVAKFSGFKNSIESISLNRNMLLVKPYSEPIQIRPMGNPEYEIAHLQYNEHNVFKDETYYKAPKEALETIGLKIGEKVYPVENFDLLYNRPDVLMENLQIASDSEVALYRNAYEKRLQRGGLDTSSPGEYFDLEKFPEINLSNSAKISPLTTDSLLEIRLTMRDEKYGIKYWNAMVNGVPVFGEGGRTVKARPGEEVQASAVIPLMHGENRIKIIAVNKEGLKSIPIQRTVNLEGEMFPRSDVYIVTIGVSDYAQDEYDLRYASKDAGDIQKLFSPVDTMGFGINWNKFNYPSDYYGDIHRISLTDKQVTKEAVLNVKKQLEKSGPGDMVLVFLAGHGMLDDGGTYYFAAHDIDFQNPAGRGITFNDIQGLFDGIPARKRVLFMDTCHSGDLDMDSFKGAPDSTATHNYGDTRIVSNLKRGVGSLSVAGESNTRDEFRLMKELFADFNATGTVIISAASGTGFALENDTWKNGVFTYSVIQGLSEYKADKNMDRRITVSELKEYVLKEVEILTEGRQTPTTRQENVEFDFRVW